MPSEGIDGILSAVSVVIWTRATVAVWRGTGRFHLTSNLHIPRQHSHLAPLVNSVLYLPEMHVLELVYSNTLNEWRCIKSGVSLYMLPNVITR